LTPYNQCFLVAQCDGLNFTIVGGFQQWRKSGRMVKKGEHGFLILVPSILKNDENSEKVDDFILDEDVRFYSATLFDITQTEKIQ